MMKIVYLHEYIICTGGLERIFVEKMNYLAEQSCKDIYLVTVSQGNHPFSFPLSKQIKHIDLAINFHSQYQFPYPKRLWVRIKMNFLFQKRFQEVIDNINPDFIICTTAWRPDIVCRIKGKAKKIIESHCARAYTAIPHNRTMGFLRDMLNIYSTQKHFRIIEKYGDAVVTLTHADAQAWEKASKVYTIPNFTKLIVPESSTCEMHRAIAVGRLTYQKGFDRLINAWKIVSKQYPDWKLDIFGEGVYKEELANQIKSNGLENIVTIHPVTKDILHEYLNSSIFILTSNYEGFALVLIEAMGCGIPCVSFDCPHGPSDIIKNKEDGILIKNGDINGLADAICYLMKDEIKRKEFGKKAKINVIRFSPKEVMSQWNHLFEEIL